MLIFLDESFRKHQHNKRSFGVLGGIAIPEDIFADVQYGIYRVRQPYHGHILKETDELHGRQLLNKTTMKVRASRGYSYQWNLAEEVLGYARIQRLTVFGVVCFRPDLHSFVCGDERKLDATYSHLFERIDRYMKQNFPKRSAKLVFDDRDHQTNKANARAITNFFNRSPVGRGYDSILRIPMFAVSQGHNYGLQLADLVTTIIALRFSGESMIHPLWRTLHGMLHQTEVAGRRQSSLKVMRNKRDSAAFANSQMNTSSTESQLP